MNPDVTFEYIKLQYYSITAIMFFLFFLILFKCIYITINELTEMSKVKDEKKMSMNCSK